MLELFLPIFFSDSPSFRTPRQYGNNYPGAPLNCYYCNLYYGGNQGGGGRPPSSGFPNPNPDDGQDEDTDGLDPFEEQPDGDRVYGGFYSKLGQWPFVVEVELRNDKSCTGILHDVNTIITAAHWYFNLGVTLSTTKIRGDLTTSNLSSF